MAALNGIVHTYNTNVGTGALAALHTAAQAVAVLAVDGNGLTRSAVATDYELVMEYQTRDTAPPHRVCAPSFQHWWLSVQGRAIEIFPGRTEIQIYQGHQPVNPLRFSMWSTYLTGFHQAQVDRIVRVLRDTRANWQGVPAVPAARQPWIADDQRSRCVWCDQLFTWYRPSTTAGTCSEIFCDACSQ